jgi:hypothetical protein
VISFQLVERGFAAIQLIKHAGIARIPALTTNHCRREAACRGRKPWYWRFRRLPIYANHDISLNSAVLVDISVLEYVKPAVSSSFFSVEKKLDDF